MPLNIDWQQILLHAFNFVLLFGILYLLLYRPVHDFMVNRSKEYEEEDKKSKENLAKSEEMIAEYEAKLKEADKEVAVMKAEASGKSEEERERIIAQAHKQADEIVSKAQTAATREHDRLIAQAESEIASYVSKAAEKIVMDKPGASDFDAFFENANAVKGKEDE